MVIDRQKNEASVWVDGEESKGKIKLESDSLIFAGRGDLALRSPVNAMVAFDDLRVAYRAFDKKEIENLAAGK